MALRAPSALEEQISADIPYVTEIRHDIHAHPELGYEEHRTSQRIKAELTKVGVEFVGGLAGGTGVLGYLPCTTDPSSARTVALRADMDALPILENTGLPYASQTPGKMHACGHDGHTSVLIGAARALAQTEMRPNNVLFVFQPAEEGGAGGNRMCEDGALSGKVLGRPADVIYGLHGSPQYSAGEVATRVGPLLAAVDTCEIKVVGQGGHAAMPHRCIDPVVAASHIVVALQTIASRSVNPLDSVVATVGILRAGTATNIIPDEAFLTVTLRTLTPETRELAQRRIHEIAENVARAHGAEATVRWTYGYPVTFNEAGATDRFREVMRSHLPGVLVEDETMPVMGAEDFSFYGRHVPASFFWLGLMKQGQECYPNLHSPEFDFNDEALPYGMRAMCALAFAG